MKKLIISLLAAPVLIAAGQGYMQSSSAQSSSSSMGVYSSRGGLIGVGKTAYPIAPGASVRISSGTKRFSNTIQEPGQPAVTTTMIERRPPQIFIDDMSIDTEE